MGVNTFQLMFEGVDRIGKTTLIDAWRATFPGYYHYKSLVPTTLQDSMNYYQGYVRDMTVRQVPIALDRGPVSEMVYAELYRNYHNAYWPSALEMIKWQSFYVQPIIVYVEPVAPHLMQADERRNARREDELIKYEDVLARFYEGNIPVVRIQTQTESEWRSPYEVVGQLLFELIAVNPRG